MDVDALCALMRSRRSIRRFTERRPDVALIERVIETACWAPSNHNRQGWKFIVFQDRALIGKLAEEVRCAVRDAAAGADRLAGERAEQLVAEAGAFEVAPVVILAMHKGPLALGRSILASATDELASGEAISVAMAVQNMLLTAHALGLGACVMTAPLLAGDVWSALADMPVGFAPTCLVALGYPAEQPDPPRRKGLQHIIEYKP